PMGRVVLEQVGIGLGRYEVVDRDDLDVGAALQRGPVEIPPDPSKSVDAHSNRHRDLLRCARSGSTGYRACSPTHSTPRLRRPRSGSATTNRASSTAASSSPGG